jgi:hypothetical protein
MRTSCLLAFILSAVCCSGTQIKRVKFFAYDINRDGITDIIYTEITFDAVSNKYHYTELTFNQFNVKVFYGTPDGLSNKAAWSFTSDSIENFSYLNFDYDVNNDGIKDLLAIPDIRSADKKTHPAIIAVLNSAKGFTDQQPVVLKDIDIPEARSRSIRFCDCNKDGFADVVVASWYELTKETSINHKTKIMYGVVNGFADPQNFDDNNRILFSGFDYDGDHEPDSIETNYTTHTTEYSFISSKKKTEEKWLSFSTSWLGNPIYRLLQVGDINNDGFSDACIVKIESNHEVKKNHVPSSTLTIFPGSQHGLTTDTLLYYDCANVILHAYDPASVTIIPLGDFDGNGSSDIFGANDSMMQYDEALLDNNINNNAGIVTPVVSTSFKKSFFVWGGNPPQTDDNGKNVFTQFINNNKLQLLNIGDVNGDKKNDLLLYNNEKQYIIYGNAERKLEPVEWNHD